MARQHDLVNEIMTGNCILILDGKKFGTALGEILKLLTASEDKVTALLGYKQLADELGVELKATRIALDRRTPEGLKKKYMNGSEVVI